jgi:hypothetical protein
MNPFPGLSALALVWCDGPRAVADLDRPVTASAGMHQGHGLRSEGAALLGCGSDYVVRFNDRGAHFTPVLGRDALAVAPLQLALQSIHRGTTPLPCDLEDAPALAGDTAVYDRSPSIRERYELRDTGMEQSFVFDTLPGRGDLVVRCRLGGLGELAAPAADGGLDFVRDGQRLVHMGTVTGIDRNGVRAHGAIRRDGDFVELSLPASFVDRAALPLVLDPFVSNAHGLAVVPSNDSAPHMVWHSAAAALAVRLRARGVAHADGRDDPRLGAERLPRRCCCRSPASRARSRGRRASPTTPAATAASWSTSRAPRSSR